MSQADMLSPTMLYRAPGEHDIHGYMVDYIVVDAPDVADMLGLGWHLTPTEAGKAMQAQRAAVKDALTDVSDVDELEPLRNQAAALGIRVDRRWKEDRLRAEIAAVPQEESAE